MSLAVIVVFVTTYLLILPAFTLEKEKAAEQGGIDLPGIERVSQDSVEDADVSDEESITEEDADKVTSEYPDNETDLTPEDMTEESVEEVEDESDPLTYEDEFYKITVEDKANVLPENTEIKVEEIIKEEDEKSYKQYCDDSVQAINDDEKTPTVADLKFARFYDIKLVADGEEINAPEDAVSVRIEYDDELAKSMNVENPDSLHIVHFAENKFTGEIEPEVLDSKTVEVNTDRKDNLTDTTFEADSFSVYGVVYTVDFSWEVNGKTYQFILPGGGYVSLESLLEVLHVANTETESSYTDKTDAESSEQTENDRLIDKSEALQTLTLKDVVVSEETKAFVADIEKAEFSNPDLVWVGKANSDSTVEELKKSNKLDVEYSAYLSEEEITEINALTVEKDDWALISLQPFASEESLTVTMKTGEVFVIKVTDSASENPAYTKISRSDMNVDNRDEGIILKLFDYSGTVTYSNQTRDIDTVWGSNTNYGSLRSGSGVNNGRTLLFSGSGLGGNEWYNNFTGTRNSGMTYYSGYRADGIVKDELVNGYPQLSDDITKYGSDDGNLDYLFKAGEQTGVTEYSANGQGLQGLLRKDENGYYYYSSEENYARFDGNDYVDLYTDTYYKDGVKSAAQNNGFGCIGFFPFTDYNIISLVCQCRHISLILQMDNLITNSQCHSSFPVMMTYGYMSMVSLH